ncbi:MAG: CorA family divalent cation transporter [Cyclobacteriaceae bacterium]|jgi:magnesium transporter
MQTIITELKEDNIYEIPSDEFNLNKRNKSSIYLYEIKTSDRHEAVKEIQSFDLDENIRDNILTPSEHIRFDYFQDVAYGELAIFASKSRPPIKYIGIIWYENILILIHDVEDTLFEDFHASISKILETNTKPEIIHLVYLLVNEILSDYGKLILTYRDEIEEIAKDFDKNFHDIDPDEFLESKSHISDFARVLEKIHFALSFPPAKNILDRESPHKVYFQELLRNVSLVEISLSKTEERLNSLHDHYNLLLQDKSNKRLNFLTIIQAIFVPATLIAGIYGMNFIYMPELNFKYGYFFSLGVMLIIALGFLRYFYKHGWFD